MNFDVYGESEIGCARRSNEDAIAWHLSEKGDNFLAVLADGMGGHEGGEIASNTVVDMCIKQLSALVEQGDISQPEMIEALNCVVVEANGQIRAMREKESALSKMGTTLLIVWGAGDQAFISNIGDSRCYRLCPDSVTQLTRDDTVAQAMVDDGSITEHEMSRIPFRNVLTKAVGPEPDLCADVQQVKFNKNEALVLCSDGLTGAVDYKQWPDIISQSTSVKQQVECLIDESINNKANDNVSVIIIRRQ